MPSHVFSFSRNGGDDNGGANPDGRRRNTTSREGGVVVKGGVGTVRGRIWINGTTLSVPSHGFSFSRLTPIIILYFLWLLLD